MDFIYNSFKVRYVKLNELFRELHLTNIKIITLYINMESILNPLHQKSYEEYLTSATSDGLMEECRRVIANIINVAAHYRAYFTRERVFSNIVFFYNDFSNDPKSNNSVHIKKYRKTYYDMYTDKKYERINEMITGAIEYCHKIIDFIDCVYMLHCNRVDASLIPYLCMDNKRLKSDLNIILTKDVYDWQYVNENFLVLVPNGDMSVILDKDNLIKYLLYKNDMLSKYKLMISPKLYPFILSVMGNRKRNLPKVKGIGFKKLYKELEKLYLKDYLSDEHPSSYNIEYLDELIRTHNGLFNNTLKELITDNYYAIDLERQFNISDSVDNDAIMSGIINRYDNNGLQRLNDKTFSETPIQLIELNNYYPNILKDGDI